MSRKTPTSRSAGLVRHQTAEHHRAAGTGRRRCHGEHQTSNRSKKPADYRANRTVIPSTRSKPTHTRTYGGTSALSCRLVDYVQQWPCCADDSWPGRTLVPHFSCALPPTQAADHSAHRTHLRGPPGGKREQKREPPHPPTCDAWLVTAIRRPEFGRHGQTRMPSKGDQKWTVANMATL